MVAKGQGTGKFSNGQARETIKLTIGSGPTAADESSATRSAPSDRGMGPRGMGPRGMGPRGMGPRGMGPEGMGPEGMGPDDDISNAGYATHYRLGLDAIANQDWRHQRYKLEFLKHFKWEKDITVEPPTLSEEFEIDGDENPHRLMKWVDGDGSDERLERYDEIVAETDDYFGLYENAARFSVLTHPNTSNLIQVMGWISWELAVYYKERIHRPRPSTVEPLVAPIIRVPAHPAYPSGHATQAHLVANALEHVLLEAGDRGSKSKDPEVRRVTEHLSGVAERVVTIAGRVAENREVAGVHYRQDSEAGEKLAEDIWKLILKRNIPGFHALIEESINEWLNNLPSRDHFIK